MLHLDNNYIAIRISVLLGLESVVKDELKALGYTSEEITVQDALLILKPQGGLAAMPRHVARLNLYLRCAERIDLELARFTAYSFDELFTHCVALPWADYLDSGAAFSVSGYSRKSKLYAVSACQSVIKKAIVTALQKARGLGSSAHIEENPEKGNLRINFSILEDEVCLSVNTSGSHLHKRGYRKNSTLAPLRETLAAGLIYLSRWEPGNNELLYDPCCGSGTFLCEAAMMAANIAPGLKRRFAAEDWSLIGYPIFQQVRREARAAEQREAPEKIFLAGSDWDAQAIAAAKANFARLGLHKYVVFQQKDVACLNFAQLQKEFSAQRILFITNPPYGERLEKDHPEQVREIHQALARLAFYPQSKFTRPGCRLTLITAADFEKDSGHPADKRRKLYNGMLKTYMYHYFREKYCS